MWDIYESTGMLPKALQSKPTLPEYLEFYWNIFLELADERDEGFSRPNPISLATFLNYAWLHQFSKEDIREAWPRIKHLDVTWRRLLSNRQSSTNDKTKTDTKNSPSS